MFHVKFLFFWKFCYHVHDDRANELLALIINNTFLLDYVISRYNYKNITFTALSTTLSSVI